MSPTPTSKPRRCLITGASRGIGRAIALKLSQEGYSVVLNAVRNREACEATAGEIRAAGGSAEVLMFDVADRGAAKAAITQDIETNGAYYGVICNAGVTADAPFPAMEPEQWDRVIRTDLDGFYNVVSPALMPMIQARCGGRIIAISSISGVVGNRGQANYSAAKAGLIGATKALAVELGKRRITCNCIAPGVIETDMTQGLPVEEVLKAIPLRRMGSAEEIAATAAFLMSDGAAYITRQVINVNGGMA